MQTFGKTMRNSMSALALGMTAFGLASVTLVTAPAAIAQKTVLSATEAVVCLSGLRQAYLVGAVRTVLIAAASVIRPSGNRRATRV